MDQCARALLPTTFQGRCTLFGLVHRVPVKTLGCKQKELPLAILIPIPFPDRQTNKKIPKKKKKKKDIHYIHCSQSRLWAGGPRKEKGHHSMSRSCKKTLWQSESEPSVLDTTPAQMSGHHPVSLSHVFIIQIGPGRRCSRTELRGRFML